MPNNLKKIIAMLLIAAISAVYATACSNNESLQQELTPESSKTASDTESRETTTSDTEKTTSAAKKSVETTTTTSVTTTTTTTTTAATTTPRPVTTTAAATTAATTTTAPPVTTTTAAPSVSSLGLADQVFELVNRIRAEYGLPAYKRLDALTSAAQKRAQELSVFYSHTRPSGQQSYSVIKEYGLNYSTTGENIAAGQMTAQQVVNDWMGSTMGHREAILSSSYQYMGVGYVCLQSNDAQGFKYYWVQEFFTPL